MADPASKLEELRINRTAISTGRSKRVIGWSVGALACLGVGAGLWLRAEQATPIIAAEAASKPAPTGAVSPAPSVLDASGYVVARRQATVSSKITGKLVEVLVEEGQRIAAGQVIARLDNTNATAALTQAEARVGEAEANLQAVEVALADAEPSFKRSEEQFRRGLTSSEHLDAARSNFNSRKMAVLVAKQSVSVARAAVGVAKQNLEDTIIRAPFAGVVTVKAAEPGEMVSPSATGGFTRTGICTIVDMDFSRGRSRCQRSLHQPGAAGASGERAPERVSGLDDTGQSLGRDPDRRPRQGHSQSSHCLRGQRPADRAGNGSARVLPRRGVGRGAMNEQRVVK